MSKLTLDEIRAESLLDEESARRLIGGTRPISRATFYRSIAAGIYPKGHHVAANSVRWSRTEIEAAIVKYAQSRAA